MFQLQDAHHLAAATTIVLRITRGEAVVVGLGSKSDGNRSWRRAGLIGAVGLVLFVLVAIPMAALIIAALAGQPIPAPILIEFGIIVVLALVYWMIFAAIPSWKKKRAAVEKRDWVRRVTEASNAKKESDREAARVEEQLITDLGSTNAARLNKARSAVQQMTDSEAARAGWLGDLDFGSDIQAVTDSYRKAQALRLEAAQLCALDTPSADDLALLNEANAAADDLELSADERIGLIERCAAEVCLIDKSLKIERENAHVAEQRAQAHAKLSSMLYGIEAAPSGSSVDSAAAAVIGRVQAYQEIKGQMQDPRSP